MHAIDKSSLQSWLSSELEQYGIDSKLYARHILDLFLNSGYTTDLMLNKREKNIFSVISDCPKRSNSKLKRKAESRSNSFPKNSTSTTTNGGSGNGSSSSTSSYSDVVSMCCYRHYHQGGCADKDDLVTTMWKKQVALERLLEAADDDVAQSNRNNIKDLIEKLHNLIQETLLSEAKSDGSSGGSLKKKPRENYNTAFPPSLAFFPMKEIDVCDTAWNSYKINKIKRRSEEGMIIEASRKMKHQNERQRSNKQVAAGSTSSSSHQHHQRQSRLSNQRRHPYAPPTIKKSTDSNSSSHQASSRNHRGKHHRKRNDNIENHKRSTPNQQHLNLVRHRLPLFEKMSQNRMHASTNNNGGSSKSKLKSVRGKRGGKSHQQRNCRKDNDKNGENKRLPLFRRFCRVNNNNSTPPLPEEDYKGSYADFGGFTPHYFPMKRSDKFVYPSSVKINKDNDENEAASAKSNSNIWNHYYLPVSMSNDFHTSTSQPSTTNTSPPATSRWFRDPETGFLKFVPAGYLSDCDVTDRVEVWKYCPSPNLWAMRIEDGDDDAEGGRASRLETVYNNLQETSTSESQGSLQLQPPDEVVRQDWERYEAIFTDISPSAPGPNAIGAGGDCNLQHNAAAADVFYCTRGNDFDVFNPYMDNANNFILDLIDARDIRYPHNKKHCDVTTDMTSSSFSEGCFGGKHQQHQYSKKQRVLSDQTNNNYSMMSQQQKQHYHDYDKLNLGSMGAPHSMIYKMTGSSSGDSPCSSEPTSSFFTTSSSQDSSFNYDVIDGMFNRSEDDDGVFTDSSSGSVFDDEYSDDDEDDDDDDDDDDDYNRLPCFKDFHNAIDDADKDGDILKLVIDHVLEDSSDDDDDDDADDYDDDESFSHLLNIFNFLNLEDFEEAVDRGGSCDFLREIDEAIMRVNEEQLRDRFDKMPPDEMLFFVPSSSDENLGGGSRTSAGGLLMECVTSHDAWKTRVRISNMWESVSGIRPVDVLYTEKQHPCETVTLPPSSLTHFRPIPSNDSSGHQHTTTTGSGINNTTTNNAHNGNYLSNNSGNYLITSDNKPAAAAAATNINNNNHDCSGMQMTSSWFDINLLKRDNQNVNDDFSCCTKCQPPGSVENEISDLLKFANIDEDDISAVAHCNCSKKKQQKNNKRSQQQQVQLPWQPLLNSAHNRPIFSRKANSR